MACPAVSVEVAWSAPATVRQDRWLSKTEPGLQTRLLTELPRRELCFSRRSPFVLRKAENGDRMEPEKRDVYE